MPQKNYFAIVHKDTGQFLVTGPTLPVFYYKRVAKEIAKGFPKYMIKPLSSGELHKLMTASDNVNVITDDKIDN